MFVRRLILFTLALLLATSPAFASTGWKSGRATTAQKANAILPGKPFAYFHIDSTSTLNSFSLALSVENAFELDVVLIADSTQSTATPTCQVRIWDSAADAGSTVTTSSGLPQIVGDTDGDGVQNLLATLDGRSANRMALRGFRASALTVEITSVPTGTEQCLVAVHGAF